MKNVVDRNFSLSIITKSLKQYVDEFNAETDYSKTSENAGCIVVFDDVLDSNQKTVDQFFTRERQKSSKKYDLFQYIPELSKRKSGDNSNILILCEQTSNIVSRLNRDMIGFDMSYINCKELCREASEDDDKIDPLIGRSKKRRSWKMCSY